MCLNSASFTIVPPKDAKKVALLCVFAPLRETFSDFKLECSLNCSRENSYWVFMTDSEDSAAKSKENARKKREEALPERLLRRVLEGMGSAVDRRSRRSGKASS